MSKNPRCLYESELRAFLQCDAMRVFGCICQNYHGDAPTTSREAWMAEIEILKGALEPWRDDEGHIVFEYDIPRLGKRIDVVVLLRGIVFCIEFKVGQRSALQADVEQTLDYALDLKNFHLYSHDKLIVPILVPTEHASQTALLTFSVYSDSIMNPLITGRRGLSTLIGEVISRYGREKGSHELSRDWIISPYSPTPTIIEAARTLYESHSVEDITRHEADKVTTDTTTRELLEVIRRSKLGGHKSICFVTGVPGAGKTLVGLDVAVKQTYQGGDSPVEDEGAVYLSGNGPLVAVLTEALAKNNWVRCRESGERKNLSDSRREVSKFIQIIHRYRDDMLAKIKNPVVGGVLEIDPEKAIRLEEAGYGAVEHVAIFDEAQRSWTHDRIANYLKRGGTYGNKLKVPNFPMSEAAFLIWSLDQREDWATIICLVGGGQEINTGEAGISEWIKALNEQFPHWKVYISDRLTAPEYAEGRVMELLRDNKNVQFNANLHLGVSLRSFRAERLSDFIHALLSFSPEAKELYASLRDKYPIYLTRDMAKARQWLRHQARGSERTGILVSKEAARFKPLAVHVLQQSDDNAVHWFLEDKNDVRASNYLEDAATEIQVQGLELDYACVLWDADFRCAGDHWEYFTFNGKTRWHQLRADTEARADRQKYMLNAYRVLLTRSRMGMVICIPAGNPATDPAGFWEDPTRLPAFYDPTYRYLRSLGLPEL